MARLRKIQRRSLSDTTLNRIHFKDVIVIMKMNNLYLFSLDLRSMNVFRPISRDWYWFDDRHQSRFVKARATINFPTWVRSGRFAQSLLAPLPAPRLLKRGDIDRGRLNGIMKFTCPRVRHESHSDFAPSSILESNAVLAASGAHKRRKVCACLAA